MFQNFKDSADPSNGKPRVAQLRKELKTRKLAAFLVPHADEYQNEYVPPCAKRLAWLTGFTGSAGMAIVSTKSSALFVDGRYTLQAPEQVDTKVFKVLQVPQNKPTDWLKEILKKGEILGYDPRLHSIKSIELMQKAADDTGFLIAPQDKNTIDAIWKNPPAPPLKPVSLHPLKFSGELAAKKISSVQTQIKKAMAAALILSSPESIAWLLNIRGQDVPHTPLPLSFAIVPAKSKPELFIDPKKLSPDVRKTLARDVKLRKPEDLSSALVTLGKKEAKILLDPDRASQWFANQLLEAGAEIIRKPDPCIALKAKKNKTEINGSRAAHKRDGIAMCRFLAWLDANAPKGKIDEIAAVKKLESFRKQTGELKEISFDTISGTGANGAIVHYRVSESTNAPLKANTLYLVDSGAQYLDGTTDITRTIAVGEPTADMRRHFTLVLKGHIGIAAAHFPKDTRGVDLDPLARSALWNAGLDFDHGTGHGVGSYLSVHEGPQNISKRGVVALEPGMIISNEPGFYREGEYGIRIENLVLVLPARKVKGGDRPMLSFETLTLAPIDRRLVDPSLLTRDELNWLNAYHARVQKILGPELGPRDRTWLERATAPLEGI